MSAQQSSSDAAMASPERLPRTIRRVSGSRGNPLLLQEPEPLPFASKGHGALTSLIKSRSHGSRTSLFAWAAGGGSDDEYGSSSAHEALLGGGPGSVTGRPSSEYGADDDEEAGRRFDERRMSALLNSSHMRSMRLIGFANPRYRWERYWKTEEQLQAFKKPVRQYYERTNLLIQQYLYIDRLLDSSLPHDLVNEYNNMPVSAFKGVEIPQTILEEPPTPATLASPNGGTGQASPLASGGSSASLAKKVKRTPRDIYRPTETTPLFANAAGSAISDDEEDDVGDGSVGNQSNGGTGAAVDGTEAAERRVKVRPASPDIPWLEDDDVSSDDAIVTLAIYVNFAANLFLLAGKIAVIIRVPSVSVLASLVDAVLDFLSTAIVWTTTWLISRQDQYQYPVGRRRLEPLGVLVFSIIMITSFAQVALEAIQRLMSSDHEVVVLGTPALVIMLSTIVIKGLCWLWCRLVKNSSVQALASDAATDVIFNAGTIAFPIVGTYARIWWLDALGGLLLSLVVMFNWSQTSAEHIKNLSGFSATADQRNILLYLTMRFAKTIKQIQGLQAYHSGDKLNVEVDIVLDASTSLKDSHDLSESLQYVLESVPIVDRAFVHVDYATYNLPTHMEQQARSK